MRRGKRGLITRKPYLLILQIILTHTLVDIETNLYTDIKQNYENYTDDL